MEIRFYTAKVIDPTKDSGAIDLTNAPPLEGAGAPEIGLLGYHKSSGLSKALARILLEAVQNKHVVAFAEITVSNLKRNLPGEDSKINVANMKPEEVPHCEIMHLGRVSASLRQEIVEILKSHASTQVQRKKLDEVTADRYLMDYITMYPKSVDHIHADERFQHMKVIIYPTGTQIASEFMVALYGAAAEDISVKMIKAVKDIEFKVPDQYILDGQQNAELGNQMRNFVSP